MVHGMVQPCGLCLVVLGFDFCLALGLKLAGAGSRFLSGGWIFCHLLSIKLLSALCSSLTSGCNIFSVFHSGFIQGSSSTFLSCSFCFSLCWWSCPLAGTQLPVSMCLMCSIRAATCSPTVLPSFTNTKQLKTTFCFMFSIESSTPHISPLPPHNLALPAGLAVFWV